MKLEVVAIPSGSLNLAALRYVPEAPPNPIALIYAHGYTSGKYSLDGLANYLATRGYTGLTFDFVGHKLGGSGGELRHLRQTTENLRDALHWLRQHTPVERVVLAGHSMGAAAVLQTAAQERRNPEAETAKLAGVVCLCLGSHPTQGFDSVVGETMLSQRSDYVAGSPPQELLPEMDTMVSAAGDLGDLPSLFIAARQDVLVPVASVEALAALAGPGASVTVIAAAHLDAPDRSRAALIRWLETLAEQRKSEYGIRESEATDSFRIPTTDSRIPNKGLP